MRRRDFLGLSATAALAAFGNSSRVFGQSNSIRIGVITALSGAGQIYGKATQTGAEIAAARINGMGGVGGRPIELIIRDDKASTDAAVGAYRELVADGVKILICGPHSAPVAAMAPLVRDTDIILMASGPTIASLTHELYNDNIFRLAFTSVPYYQGLAQVVAKNNNVRKWAVVAFDIQTYVDIAKVISNGIRKYTAEYQNATPIIMDAVSLKAGAGDYRSQISQIANSDADGLILAIAGADEITFLKQLKQFGIVNKFKAVIDNGGAVQLAKAVGKDLPPNMWAPTLWQPGTDNENAVSKALYEEYVRRTNDRFPFGYVAPAFDSVLVLADAIKNSKPGDVSLMRAALEQSTTLGASGIIKFRKEDHAYIGNLTYLNFGPDPDAADGWKMIQVVQVPSLPLMEPATPGKKLVLD